MPRIQLYDTTLRDGAQAEGISFSLQDKLALTQRLDDLGFDYVEGGYPASNEKDAQFFQQVRGLNLRHARVCAFGMTRRKGTKAEDDPGLRTLAASRASVATLVGKASVFQVTEVLRTTREENLAMIAESIALLVRGGQEVIFDAEHFFDGWKLDRDYALQALHAAVQAGVQVVVLCDTNGGSLPEEVAETTRAVVAALGVPVGIHCHNDCELGVANSLTAVDAGAVQVQGTINGFGERCGNADLISVAANLAFKKRQYEVLRPDASRYLTELSRYVYEMVNMNFRAHQPFVGKSAFAHKGGMHVSGVSRVAASYEHMDPGQVGNERRILVSELSGRSNIVALTTRHNIQHDPKLMDQILARVVSMESAGYQFEAAEGSFDLLVRKCLGTFRPHFERLSYHVNVETNAHGAIRTEATVKIRIGDQIRHEVAEGDGPVNALDAAMRKALNGSFPNLAKLHLVDYKVRVINSEAATAAGVRVVVESQDEDDVWGTVGVSENVIEASWIALVDSFEYKLCKDEEKKVVSGQWSVLPRSPNPEPRSTTHEQRTTNNAMPTTPSQRELPKQYDHVAAQDRWYRFWEEKGYFHSEPNPQRKPFSIVIPPPNVTGALHLGHALNNTLQDILIRQKRMQGFETLWLPGTDHAGIATQAVVERRLLEEEKLTRHDLGREGLVARIWQWKNEYEQRILNQLKEMGCSCDWQRTRFTLDPVCARAVRHTFFSLFREKLIYRGKRLVNWDTMLQTAVSDDEVFHEAVAGHFWYFNYPVIDPGPGEPTHVTLATTRPETMLGDTAVAVHPDPAAALKKAEKELRARLAAAPAKQKPELQAELEEVQRRRETMLPQLLVLRDMARRGRKVLLPLMEREIPLIADEWAKPELGTGCVKITPAHDPNDYEVGLRHGLPMINILNLDGTLSAEAGRYQGQTVMEARQRVVADLQKQGLVAKVEDRQIDLAHSDRSKSPIEPLLTDQWFVKMERLAQTAMDAVTSGRVRIIPERYAKGYLDWLSEKRDWPISRQLWWGHQIPIWYCKTAHESDLKRAFAGRKDVVWHRDEEYDQWLICAQEEDLPEDAVLGHKLVREQDVLDTWFSSALWPHSTLGWPEPTPELRYYYPTSVLITNRDIITLWVARMVLTGLHNVGEVPFREVYIHPKILDGYGEGMSKSKGNGVDPLDVMDKFGADALRFGLAYLTTETQDIRMPVDFECPHCGKLIEQTKENRMLPRIKCKHCGGAFSTQWASEPADKALPRGPVVNDRFELARNFCNKLWNASRFALMNLEGFSEGEVAEADLLVEDRWILSRLSTVTRQVTEALAEYRYADAARALYDFAWDEFCSFYVEMVKGRLQDEAARPVAQRVLAHTLDALLRLLHPMVPFVTEEVWQLLAAVAPVRGIQSPRPAAESIMIAPWPEPAREDEEIEARFARFQEVLRAVRDIRSRQGVKPKARIEFSVRCDAATADLLRPMEPYFVALGGARLTASSPEVEAPVLSANAVIPGIEVYVDLAGIIDVSAEIERKKQELEKRDALITAKEKKLANANFVNRAPAEVVQKERDSLKDLQDQQAATTAVLAQLVLARPEEGGNSSS